MLILMEAKPEGSLAAMSGDDSSQSASDTGNWSCSDRKCKRREKNRVAAQKSRKKQTERADALHQELQSLEHSNAAYEKEIAQLRLELEQYSSVLKEHEPHCCIFSFSSQRTIQNATSSTQTPAAPLPAAANHTELSLPDFLDGTEWSHIWDAQKW
ncbi:hypothetical protein AGOR_G00075100 [Albula goreensis]|uniref:BZIP domain-containing protein n=1 Tax=Albula goreensis TaxID=1534307 RepID=A0A8T3DNA1_9TELE|nr:hypothetical protein AGOR_G00075100 [Albula goreensis]